MSKTFNIYCDESCHIENDHKKFMFLGSVSAAYNQVKLHTEKINDLKKKHNFYAEIKWSKVSKSKIRFYLDLVDYFFATDLQFRTVGVEKSKINNNAFNQNYDDFYYKMYYYLLNHNLSSLYKYNVYLDIKEPKGNRTYIYNKDEKYVIVLEPLRNKNEYYLLSAYYVRGKDAKRSKFEKKYKRRLAELL